MNVKRHSVGHMVRQCLGACRHLGGECVGKLNTSGRKGTRRIPSGPRGCLFHHRLPVLPAPRQQLPDRPAKPKFTHYTQPPPLPAVSHSAQTLKQLCKRPLQPMMCMPPRTPSPGYGQPFSLCLSCPSPPASAPQLDSPCAVSLAHLRLQHPGHSTPGGPAGRFRPCCCW